MPGIFDLLSGAAGAAGMGTGIGAAAGAVGLGLSIMGSMNATNAAQQQSQTQQAMVGTEMQQDAVRRTAMEVQARRDQLQSVRNAQQAQSVALQRTTSQGSSGIGSQSSALGGAEAGISGAAKTNQLGISQNLAAGEQMFNLNAQLDQQKIQYAQEGSSLATAQGMSSLGGSLMGSIGNIRSLFS